MTQVFERQHLLDEFVDRLRTLAGPNLESVVLYGSAADGAEFHVEHSDLNLLCLLRQCDAASLERIQPAVAWWQEHQQPLPTFMTGEELSRSADVFPIEITDMQQRHRVLHGDDAFLRIVVEAPAHRVQLEHELRRVTLRLRRGFLAAGSDSAQQLAVMMDSLSTFLTLFRHALAAMGERPPQHRDEVVDRLASALKFDAAPFHRLLQLRQQNSGAGKAEVKSLFAGYLAGITRVVEEVDRHLETSSAQL